MDATWLDDALLALGDSECGRLARAHDWASGPLGDPATWPSELRAAVTLCFSTRFPVVVAWGPSLTMVYNDGYRDMLGSGKHPAAFGASFETVWDEIWDEIGPLCDEVLATGQPVWRVDMPLLMHRSGYDEETSFTFSYSALRDDDGTVQGVLDIAAETTALVVAARRLDTISDLASRLFEIEGSAQDVVDAAMEVLATSADVADAELWLEHGSGADDVEVVRGTTGAGPGLVPVEVLEAVARGRHVVEHDGVVVHALGALRRDVTGALALRPASRRPLDGGNREFQALVASKLGNAIGVTLAHEREVDHHRSVSEVLQRAMLPEALPPGRWHVHYQPAESSLEVGGDWYDVVPLGEERSGVVVGDCVGHGLEAATHMGQLRAAARALLLTGHGPAATLEGLDRYARTVPGAEFTTVVCAVVDEGTGELTYSAAGHPFPLVVGADGHQWLRGGRGGLLALLDAPRTEATHLLRPGDALLLYTDGLVERRGESLRTGLERLASVGAPVVRDADRRELGELLSRAMRPDGASDDIALVLYDAAPVATATSLGTGVGLAAAP
ncbi:PP2C family protein-serine/threonine phosphatase [Luteimicrobium sp. DT211]|uniref:PP2C family protein-serine/threonine phosphatase n=1 Tax=Luteimicrobium sp. DT211 TaxID=3393412 RepID=UPI003CE76330